ncbi:MAG: hypothetical protein JKY52_00195 [Flavobacteriales bacterium]|nr:hypothetical protein [Flavobacteriales bacterium]
MTGRPSAYTKELGDEILVRISAGEKITHIAHDKHMPALSTIYLWKSAQEGFSEAFAHARDEGCDAISFQALEIADDVDIDPAHKRVMVDTRLKLLGMWSNRYSAKQSIDHTTAGKEIKPAQQASTAELEALIASHMKK